jgi:hypothetical protein
VRETQKLNGYRVGFATVCVLVLAILVLTPPAIVNLIQQVQRRQSHTSYSISLPDDPPGSSYTRLHLELVSLDEAQRLITARVSGFRVCSTACGDRQQIVLFSIGADDSSNEAVPPSQAIDLPTDSSEITARFDLPLMGDLASYPFDNYRLVVGAAVKEIKGDGTTSFLAPAEARSQVFMQVENQIPRIEMSEPRQMAPESVRPGHGVYDYLYVNEVGFSRPFYLRVLIVLIVVLIAAAGAYALFMRPFDQLIINAGALVLGVWGIRSLVLGSYPPDITAVDLALMLIIFLLLCGITLRALHHTHSHSRLVLPASWRPSVSVQTAADGEPVHPPGADPA